MIFRPHKKPAWARRIKVLEDDKEKTNIENSINQKILDSILDDDEDEFSQLISENIQDPSQYNKTFQMTNFKIPNILTGNPTYASLCACFSAEKCFTALSLFLPAGTASEEMKKLDEFKRSPIHFACIGGSLNIIRELDQSMFDLNAKDENGYLPSHYAAMAGHFDVIKYLWTKGADLTSPSYCNFMTPLKVSCFYGNLDIVKFICETVITDKKSDDYWMNFLPLKKEPTPLHYACKGGHDNIVNYFISKPEIFDKQINSLDSTSRNPLLCACHNGSLSCVKTLLNHSNGKIKLDMKGRKHLALVDAAEGGYLDIVQYLVKQNIIKIKIQQETTENMSALHAAVLNDHLDIVKFLIQNGAAINLSVDKIGHIFFSALKIENFDLISYLDEVLKIPYTEKYQVEQVTTRSSYLYRRKVEENKSKNLNYGDIYIEQACLYENRKMVEYLLDKKCSLDYVDITKIIAEKSLPFIQFLVEKGFDLNCAKNPSVIPPIVTTIKIGDLNLIEKYIALGAVLNNEIILKYKCLEIALNRDHIKILQYLLQFKPELKSEEATNLFRIAFEKTFLRYRLNYSFDLIESLLKNFKVDLNSKIQEYSSSTFISYAAVSKDFRLLRLFEKYGHDYTDTALQYEEMTSSDFLPVYIYLKEHGCKFEKRIFVKKPIYLRSSSENKNKNHLCPLHKLFYCGGDTEIILFMLDFSTPKQIIATEKNEMNLIDFFIHRECYNGVIKTYSLIKGILYPLSISVQMFNNWVNSSGNLNLINTVFKSGFPIVSCGENDEIDYDDDDSDSYYSDDIFLFDL